MIELPWPPSKLLPNKKLHWAVKRPIVKKYRSDCFYLCQSLKGKSWPDTIPVMIEFYPPDRRKRDDDNMIGAFKAGRDGMADAMGVDDNRFKTAYKICEPVKKGKIIIRFDL